MKKKNKPFISIQDLDIYKTDFILAVDMTKSSFKRFIDKQNIKKEFKKQLLEDDVIWEKCNGMVIDYENGGYLFILNNYKDEWPFWETLMHECSHLVDFIARRNNFILETEAKAYLHEYLFRNLRRTIYNYYKK